MSSNNITSIHKIPDINFNFNDFDEIKDLSFMRWYKRFPYNRWNMTFHQFSIKREDGKPIYLMAEYNGGAVGMPIGILLADIESLPRYQNMEQRFDHFHSMQKPRKYTRSS